MPVLAGRHGWLGAVPGLAWGPWRRGGLRGLDPFGCFAPPSGFVPLGPPPRLSSSPPSSPLFAFACFAFASSAPAAPAFCFAFSFSFVAFAASLGPVWPYTPWARGLGAGGCRFSVQGSKPHASRRGSAAIWPSPCPAPAEGRMRWLCQPRCGHDAGRAVSVRVQGPCEQRLPVDDQGGTDLRGRDAANDAMANATAVREDEASASAHLLI